MGEVGWRLWSSETELRGKSGGLGSREKLRRQMWNLEKLNMLKLPRVTVRMRNEPICSCVREGPFPKTSSGCLKSTPVTWEGAGCRTPKCKSKNNLFVMVVVRRVVRFCPWTIKRRVWLMTVRKEDGGEQKAQATQARGRWGPRNEL